MKWCPSVMVAMFVFVLWCNCVHCLIQYKQKDNE